MNAQSSKSHSELCKKCIPREGAVCRLLGHWGTCGPGGGPWLRFSQWPVGRLPLGVLSAASRSQAALLPFDTIIYLFSHLPAPTVLQVPPPFPGVHPAAACTAGKADTHSPLSLSPEGGSPPLVQPSLYHMGGGEGDAGKVPLTSQCIQTCTYFCSTGVLCVTSGSLDCYKVSVICGGPPQ